jgi:putative ABC transport system permease protein
LGKVLEIGKEKKPFIVTGIVKDDDRSSQFKASLWLPIDNQLTQDPLWTSAATYNYMLLKENNTQADLEAALDRLLEKQVYPHASGVPQNISLEDYKKNENAVKFFVHPLVDIHLKSKLNYEISAGGNESNMYTFAAIAVFILLLASVNFINLTTARASRRAKEVGIRKAVGSTRDKLVLQFMMESVLISVVAMALSLVLAELFLPAFEFVTGDQLLNTLWNNSRSIFVLLGFAIVVGFISGVYPAFYLTAFKPVNVLKGNLTANGGASFRNFLVVFQFSISIGLMICSAVIVQQMNFMKTKDLGFNPVNVVTLDNVSKLGAQTESFKNELAQQAGVSNVSLHTGEPGSKAIMTFNMFQTPAIKDGITINTYLGDAEYANILGFRLLKGRTFNKDLASDSSSVILNESAVKALGLEEPIGTIRAR